MDERDLKVLSDTDARRCVTEAQREVKAELLAVISAHGGSFILKIIFYAAWF